MAPFAVASLPSSFSDTTLFADPEIQKLVARDDWNQTFVDNERNKCPNAIAAQECCPGYCPCGYSHQGTLTTACPPFQWDYCWFGNIKVGHHDLQCCDNKVKYPVLGSDTKAFQASLGRNTTDVTWLQEQCAKRGGANPLAMLRSLLSITAAIMVVAACS